MSIVVSRIRLWRAVLAEPHVLAVFATTGVGRLARAAVPLSIVLTVASTTGSYAWAGVSAAALTIADATTAPVKGRLVDRFGRLPVLLPGSIVYAAALCAMALPERPDQAWVLVCAAVAGIGFPPMSGSVKSLLPSLTRDADQLQAAYTLESTVQQLLFFAGPVYVAAVATAFSPRAALLGAAATTVGGVAGFVMSVHRIHVRTETADTKRRWGGALTVPAVVVLTSTTLLQSMIFGANSVAVAASASEFGMPAAAGLVLAAGPIGGLVGGLLIAPTGARPQRRYVGLLLIAAAAYAPMILMPFPAIAVWLFAGGLVVTPVAATCYLMLSEAAPAGLRTEAFTWLSTAVAAGMALGSAGAGLAVDHVGTAPALLIATFGALSAAAVGMLGKRPLTHSGLDAGRASRS